MTTPFLVFGPILVIFGTEAYIAPRIAPNEYTSQKRLPGKVCSVKCAVKDDLDLYCPEFPGKNSKKLFQNFKI